VLLTDFCNRPTSRAPAVDRSIPGVLGPLSQSAHHPTESPPPDTPGRLAFDDAIRASVDPSLTRSAIWRSRAPLNPGGLRYRRALEGAPPVPRRCLPRARSACRPLTPPVTTSSAPFGGTAFAGSAYRTDRLRNPCDRRCSPPEPPFPRIPSRALIPCDPRRLPSTSARSTRRRPFGKRRISNASPPPVLGLCRPFNPASDALSPPRSGEGMARPRPLPCALHARALLATRRSSTSAIETICKHDLRTSKPDDASTSPRERFRLRGRGLLDFRRTPPRPWRDRSSFAWGHRRFYTPVIPSNGSRGFTGQGPLDALQSLIALPASSAMIAHRGGFAPTRSTRTPHVAPPASTTIGAP
jgi:hypothetical protein